MHLNFEPKRVLVLSKSSLLEYEFERTKKKYSSLVDPNFLKDLAKQITKEKVDEYRRRHDQQLDFINSITKALRQHGIEYKVVQRKEYSNELVVWGDLIISAGGDGTFLAAAKRIKDTAVPVIGINTDPIGSEGYLCLTGKAQRPPQDVIEQFLKNEFKWMYRQRIRVTILRSSPSISASSSTTSIGVPNSIDAKNDAADDLSTSEHSSNQTNEILLTRDDETQTIQPQFRNSDEENSEPEYEYTQKLALNEVFIGESHAARVSYYDVQLDDGPMMKQKSSGITICTGTGSTSWHYNINQLTEQNLVEILDILSKNMGINFDQEINNNVIEEVCHRFNERLVFKPDEQKMAFSIRDPVFNSTFPKTPSRGFAKKIRIKSRCLHAHLILDGSTSIPFNRGAEVLLEIHSDDALRTVVLT